MLALALALIAVPGTRALPLEIDLDSGRLQIGELADQLPDATLTATIAAGRVLLSTDVRPGLRAPTRWTIHLERVNKNGFVVGRDLPTLGTGLPPLAVAVDLPPPGEHLRARLEITCGRFDGAETAPVFVPPLAVVAPVEPPTVALIIDGKEARLPLGQRRITFDLDVPATATLKVHDKHGVRWIRRAISASIVTRPSKKAPAELGVSPKLYALTIGRGRMSLPELQSAIAEAGADGGRAWARVVTAGQPAAWRLRFGGPGVTVERYGVGAPPPRIEVPVGRLILSWVEIETSTAEGARVTSGRHPLGLGKGSTAPRIMARILDSGRAGTVVRVGTSTGAMAILAVPEEY